MLTAVVLVLFWTSLSAAVQVRHGQQPHSPTGAERSFRSTNAASTVRHNTPCFVDDIATALQEAAGNDSALTNSSFLLFGSCTVTDHPSGSVLLELNKDLRNRREDLKVLHPAAVLDPAEDEQGTIMVTFDIPQSPLLRLKPVLLLAFESPPTDRDLDVTFTSHFLQPHTQSACISQGTKYILLTGKPSESTADQKWKISVGTKSPDMKKDLNDMLIGGKSGSATRMTPLLLFPGGTGSDTRHDLSSSSTTEQTSFLCELRRFLHGILPQGHSVSPAVQLDTLQSLPPLMLGLSSSETLLAAIINSSAPTIFSFSRWASTLPVRQEQLAMSPALLEEISQRLEQSEMQIMELIREEKVAHSAKERLRRLKELIGLQRNEPVTGESQYCAFLLLKALQTVVHTYDVQKRLRATRADPRNPSRANICGLKSLTVSFENLFLGPVNSNINNCHGSCAFPLTNGNNHAVLLKSHTEDVKGDERAPCCVPVAYDPLEVLDWNDEGSFLSVKPNIIAKECGCR